MKVWEGSLERDGNWDGRLVTEGDSDSDGMFDTVGSLVILVGTLVSDGLPDGSGVGARDSVGGDVNCRRTGTSETLKEG